MIDMQQTVADTYPLMPFVTRAVWDQMVLLGISGAAGAFARAAWSPEINARRRVAQGLSGALSAVFLGGLLASLISRHVTEPEAQAFVILASGFLLGVSGELGVKKLQDKLWGKTNG